MINPSYSIDELCVIRKDAEPLLSSFSFLNGGFKRATSICEIKCHSLKEIKVDEVFIPRWEDSPYCSLASEWDIFTELCENWNLKLKRAKPLEGFPGSSAGKASTCNARDPGLIPGLGRSAGEGIGYPFQYC